MTTMKAFVTRHPVATYVPSRLPSHGAASSWLSVLAASRAANSKDQPRLWKTWTCGGALAEHDDRHLLSRRSLGTAGSG